MPLSIKVNLRVTGHCNQGGRKYMEDMFSVAYQQTSDDKDLEYAFFGIFDGHGGSEASVFAKEHLMDTIVKQKNFWSDKDEDVLRAIRDGYVNTHYAMWRELEKWPKTASGLPSTAGTTASVAFIRKGKIYIGHVGDSGIILGYQDGDSPMWKAKALTEDHKPESGPEIMRIIESGGKVITKSGVPRVVWNRPKIGHKGPVRRSTHIDEIPFLAVARSLGDLWSYNSELDKFVVSPEPDVKVVTIDVKSHRCLIFGTDGLWNMLTPQAAVGIVQAAEKHNEKHFIASQQTGSGTGSNMWINPSKGLVDRALEKWASTRLRADNTSVVTLMLDPPGPSRGEVLMNRKKESVSAPKCIAVPISPVAHSPSLASREPFEKSAPLKPTEILTKPQTITEMTRPKTPSLAHTIINGHANTKVPKTSSEIVPEEMSRALPFKSSGPVNESQMNSMMKATTSANFESIQVPEISSSDLSSMELGEEHTELSRGDQLNDTFKILNPETFDVIPSLESLVENLPLMLTPQKASKFIEKPPEEDGFLLTRQNAFTGSCSELTMDHMKPSITSDHFQRQSNDNPLAAQFAKCSNVIITTKTELRSTKRRQSINTKQSQVMPATSSCVEAEKLVIPSVKSRLKVESSLPETTKKNPTACKRRHSTTLQKPEDANCSSQEPLSKRRTRSGDQSLPTDENDPSNKGKETNQKCRLRWPHSPRSIIPKSQQNRTETSSCPSSGIKDGNSPEKLSSPSSSFQRRSLEKKATPVKTIRRPSINGSNRVQLRGSFALREWDQSKSGRRSHSDLSKLIGSTNELSTTSQRWLRSDTIAATPIKTLRSRNVDIAGHTVPPQIAHQYGIVKQNRSSFNPRSLGTRSRLKRLGK